MKTIDHLIGMEQDDLDNYVDSLDKEKVILLLYSALTKIEEIKNS
jgi:hypothetical protein